MPESASPRKLIRPGSGEGRREVSRAIRRKQTPPEQTNAEEFYYLKQMTAKTPMVVVLTDGEELEAGSSGTTGARSSSTGRALPICCC